MIAISEEDLKEVIRKIAHDSRTQLQLGSNYARILDKKYPDPEAKKCIDIIVSSNKKAQELLDSLLEEILRKAVQDLG